MSDSDNTLATTSKPVDHHLPASKQPQRSPNTKAREKKLGIVFSGGGGKGAYQIGVWKALKEFDIDSGVHAVAGTSVGGLNAALFVQGDQQKAEALWRSISTEQILSMNKEGVAKKAAAIGGALFTPALQAKAIASIASLLQFQGLFSQAGLSHLIKDSGACEAIAHNENQRLPLYVCSLNIAKLTLEYPQLTGRPASEVQQWLLATSAIPLIFDGITIGSTTYYDGGVLPGYNDNTPYKVLIEQQACTHIINLHLERSPELAMAQKNNPTVRFWDLVPTRSFKGTIEALNFSPENIATLIDEGYEDTKRILEQFKHFQDTEDRYLDAVFDYAESDRYFIEQIQLNQQLRSSANNNKSSRSLKDIMADIAEQISEQEQHIIDQSLDELIDEMQDNSLQLLDEAFSSISTLASTDGMINEQLEQGWLSRLWGNLSGSNNQRQAEVNYGLNRAIYANQQLIQKLNHKSMLTMEAVSVLAYKSNYLMSHINMLYAKAQHNDQRIKQALSLMQESIQAVQQQVANKFSQLEQRLESLERDTLLENWSLSIREHYDPKSNKLSATQTLLAVTASFYTTTGRAWSSAELHRYSNTLKQLDLKHRELIPADLIWSSAQSRFLDDLGQEHILPIDPQKQDHFPLLKAMQKLSEDTAPDPQLCKHLQQHYQWDLFSPIKALNLGLELLNASQKNDRREPEMRTSHQIALTDHSLISKQQKHWQTMIQTLQEINEQHSQNKEVQKNLTYLEQKITDFTIVIPIIGKFSSGKSSLLNCYLGDDYLSIDICPQTAIATELYYGETPQLSIYYLDQRPVVQYQFKHASELKQRIETLNQQGADIAFIRIALNNQKLKNRQQLTLVDMPGFDAPSLAHQKAIAQYLQRGDFFINLMPADLPFDDSILDELEEIKMDYQKEIVCLFSKIDKITSAKLQQNKDYLKQQLNSILDGDISIGSIHCRQLNQSTSSDQHQHLSQGINDFDDHIDRISRHFDDLLRQRYQTDLQQSVAKLSEELQRQINYANNSAIEIEQKIASKEAQFAQRKKSLLNNLDELQYNLCSRGKESLMASVQSALSAQRQRLISAGKGGSLDAIIMDIVRPVLQRELDTIIEQALHQFSQKLDHDNQLHLDSLAISLQIPPEEKESFSLSTAVIAGGVGALFLGPMGLLAGLLGFFGGSDNEAERQQAIAQQVDGQVIPQAVSHIMQSVESHLMTLMSQFKQQMMQQLEQNKQQEDKELNALQQQHKERSEEFEQQQSNRMAALQCVQDYLAEL